MSRDADQSEILRVLADRIRDDGAPSLEVRQWVAQELAGMRIAGPWECTCGRSGAPGGGNPRLRTWARRHIGREGHRLDIYAALAQTDGGGDGAPRTWGGWANGGLHLSDAEPPEGATWETLPETENLTEAMALLDAQLVKEGWFLQPVVGHPCPRCKGFGLLGNTRCTNCYGDGEDRDGDALREGQGTGASAA